MGYRPSHPAECAGGALDILKYRLRGFFDKKKSHQFADRYTRDSRSPLYVQKMSLRGTSVRRIVFSRFFWGFLRESEEEEATFSRIYWAIRYCADVPSPDNLYVCISALRL